jgi:hypothetical protein
VSSAEFYPIARFRSPVGGYKPPQCEKSYVSFGEPFRLCEHVNKNKQFCGKYAFKPRNTNQKFCQKHIYLKNLTQTYKDIYGVLKHYHSPNLEQILKNTETAHIWGSSGKNSKEQWAPMVHKVVGDILTTRKWNKRKELLSKGFRHLLHPYASARERRGGF